MVRFIYFFIVLATVINGSTFWLKRVGWIENDTYQALQSKREVFNERALYYQIHQEEITEKIIIKSGAEYAEFKSELTSFLYSTPGYYGLTKLLKYLVSVAFIVLIIYLGLNSRIMDFSFRTTPFLFASIVCISFGVSFLKFGWLVAASGYNTFMFAGIAYLAGVVPLHYDIRFLSKLLIVSIFLLCVLVPIELIYGLKVFNTDSIFLKRACGFMNQPTNMGIYAACVFSLFMTYFIPQQKLWSLIMIFILIVFLIIFSGSNTAMIIIPTIVLFAYPETLKKLSLNNKIILIAFVLISLTAMFALENRPVFGSFLGRIERYHLYFSQDISIFNYLFGQGLGIGSNTLQQVLKYLTSNQPNQLPYMAITDSNPLLLITQIGLFGCIIFYIMLLHAMLKDKQFRLAYLAFILSSFTINIIELFPLNFVLALMVAKTYRTKSQQHRCNPNFIEKLKTQN